MAGTLEGGRKAAATNKERHGKDFYVKNGKLSHKAWVANGRKPKGFAARPDLASEAGKLGGQRRWAREETWVSIPANPSAVLPAPKEEES